MEALRGAVSVAATFGTGILLAELFSVQEITPPLAQLAVAALCLAAGFAVGNWLYHTLDTANDD